MWSTIALKDRYELFDQEQLAKAIGKFMPSLRVVTGSVCVFQAPGESVQTLYIELEKTKNFIFSLKEIKELKEWLRKEIPLRVERLVPHVFMTRNQEELLRNILALSKEIEQETDLPHVMISFETQTAKEFVFNVVYVRVELPFSPYIGILLNHKDALCQWFLERKQLVKYLQCHQPIFAYTFRVHFTPHEMILRSDNSLNFFSARQKLVSSLRERLGEFRDFNGGILVKQEERLLALREAFPKVAEELLENIYYSITPIEMQIILPLSILQLLVKLFFNISEAPSSETSHYVLHYKKTALFFVVVVRISDEKFYEIAKNHLLSFELPNEIRASSQVMIQDMHVLGYILEVRNDDFQNRFLESLIKLLKFWDEEANKQQILHLVLENPIHSLDPRLGGGDTSSTVVLKMLFEGLMHVGPKGNLEQGLAERIEISSDQKCYCFYLRPSVWSNGLPITSYDFEYAWKQTLLPHSHSRLAYFFYPIKNAKLANKGLVPMDQIGVYPLGDRILQVELESAAFNFLELLTLPCFSPICKEMDLNQPNWPFEEEGGYVCNGAFLVSKNSQHYYLLSKNPLYWNSDQILFDKILITTIYSSHKCEFLHQKKIHWYHIASEVHAAPSAINDKIVTIHKDNGVFWCTCNTKHPLLRNKNIRKAFNYAIEREGLFHLMKYYKLAYSPLPEIHAQVCFPWPSLSKKEIYQLFLIGLQEVQISITDVPPLVISYIHISTYGKIVAEYLCQQWKEIFPISITIQGEVYEYKNLVAKLHSGHFDFFLSRWQGWINDPFYTLNCFAEPEDRFNYSRWSHPMFQKFLKQAQQEIDLEKRKLLLKKSEKILINEMPIIPLFYTHYQSIRKKSLLLHPNYPLLDFKWLKLELEEPPIKKR